MRELNQVCQKPNYRTVGNWMVRRIERPLALYVTWALIHTPITAHQVTFLASIAGVAAAVMFAHPSGSAFLIAALLLQTWYLLDHVDGQVARYRNAVSLEGVFFDFIMHHLIDLLPFFCIGLGFFRKTGQGTAVVLGFIASVSLAMISILSDSKIKAYHQSLLKRGGVFRIEEAGPSVEGPKASLFRRIFSFFHKTCEVHIWMNTLTFFGLVYVFAETRKPDACTLAIWALLYYYAVTASIVWLMKTYHFIKAGLVTTEFERVFKKTGFYGQ